MSPTLPRPAKSSKSNAAGTARLASALPGLVRSAPPNPIRSGSAPWTPGNSPGASNLSHRRHLRTKTSRSLGYRPTRSRSAGVRCILHPLGAQGPSALERHAMKNASTFISIGRNFCPSLNSIVVPENSTTEQNARAAENAPERTSDATESLSSRLKVLGWSGIVFAILQSACTAVIAISGVRVAIGLGALAAAAGIHAPAKGFHQDAIRIPMMLFA